MTNTLSPTDEDRELIEHGEQLGRQRNPHSPQQEYRPMMNWRFSIFVVVTGIQRMINHSVPFDTAVYFAAFLTAVTEVIAWVWRGTDAPLNRNKDRA